MDPIVRGDMQIAEAGFSALFQWDFSSWLMPGTSDEALAPTFCSYLRFNPSVETLVLRYPPFSHAQSMFGEFSTMY